MGLKPFFLRLLLQKEEALKSFLEFVKKNSGEDALSGINDSTAYYEDNGVYQIEGENEDFSYNYEYIYVNTPEYPQNIFMVEHGPCEI